MPKTNVPLRPRNPEGKLLVVVIGRISTPQQEDMNIDASYRYVQRYLAGIYDGEMDIRFLGEQASGMRTDRRTIREAEDLIDTGQVDLVIAEDLSRIYRNPRHQYNFVQDAVDRGTRVICIADGLDTADENWEIAMGTAALRHGLFIPDTRRRVRRTATEAFHRGGMVLRLRFGYRKLTQEEAASGHFGPAGLRIAKLPECTPILLEMRRRVIQGQSCTAVADYLNAEDVAPGPWVKHGHWTGRLVADLLRDPILCGHRTFRQTLYEPVYETGKHRRRKNAEPERAHWPELAHMTSDEFESLQQALAKRQQRKSLTGSSNPRFNVPRSRSIWPGQAATCGVCLGPMYLMGKQLRCRNALKCYGRTCWNRVHVPAELTRQRLVDWILAQFDMFPAARQQFIDSVGRAIRCARQRLDNRSVADQAEVKSLEHQAANLVKAIAEGGNLNSLVRQLAVVESRIMELQQTLSHAETDRGAETPLPDKNDLPQLAGALREVAHTDFEFAEVIRFHFMELEIKPVQALDTGLVRPRGKLRVRQDDRQAMNRNEDEESADGSSAEVVFDLFTRAAHIAALPDYLRAVRSAEAEGQSPSLRELQAATGINYMTLCRAAAYHRRMVEVGATEPYVELHTRPLKASRWR